MLKKLNFNLNQFFKNISVKKQYLKSLKKTSTVLNNLKQKNYKLASLELFNNKYYNFSNIHFITYIIDITFSRSNTFLHVMDFSGKLIFYCSSGKFNYKGKQKKVYRNIFKNIYTLLVTKLKILKDKPIAIHLKNVGPLQFWIIKKLKKKFFIKIVKIFNIFPFNGCRKKKIRRKKQKKRRNG